MDRFIGKPMVVHENGGWVAVRDESEALQNVSAFERDDVGAIREAAHHFRAKTGGVLAARA